MTAPVAYGLVCGVLKGLVTAVNRHNLGTEHTHALHVHCLTLHIKRAHINPAGHIHKGTYGCSGHSVLSCTGLGNDTGLAHTLGQQNLTDGVVDLVGTGVVQVLTLKIELAAVFGAHA